MFKKIKSRLQKKKRAPLTKSWEAIVKTYAKPRLDHQILANLTGPISEKALFGVTTIILQDRYSGEIRISEVLGSNETVMDELFNRASEFGTVRHTWGDETFVISKWGKEEVSPTKMIDGIPVRAPLPHDVPAIANA